MNPPLLRNLLFRQVSSNISLQTAHDEFPFDYHRQLAINSWRDSISTPRDNFAETEEGGKVMGEKLKCRPVIGDNTFIRLSKSLLSQNVILLQTHSLFRIARGTTGGGLKCLNFARGVGISFKFLKSSNWVGKFQLALWNANCSASKIVCRRKFK